MEKEGGGGGLDAIQTCLVLTKYGVVSCDPGGDVIRIV